ncbi:AI-2E family transporter [bacterium]|nr:AI-2E family transporter [bacterium]
MKDLSFEEKRFFIILAAAVATLIWIHEVAVLLFVSYGLALAFDPYVTRYEAKGRSRARSAIFLGTLVLLVALIVILLIVPPLIRETVDVIAEFPRYLDWVNVFIRERLGSVLNFPKDVSVDQEALRSELRRLGTTYANEIWEVLKTGMLQGYSIGLALLNILLLPFFTFYMICDLERIHSWGAELIPPRFRSKTLTVLKQTRSILGAFVKGQLMVCFALGILYSIGFSVISLPNAIGIGMSSGMLGIVPYLGSTVALIFGTLLSVVTYGTFTAVFLAWTVIAVVQLLESFVLTPKLVGETVGVHPLVVMVALMIGGNLFGLVGIVLAVPVAAVAKVLLREIK